MTVLLRRKIQHHIAWLLLPMSDRWVLDPTVYTFRLDIMRLHWPCRYDDPARLNRLFYAENQALARGRGAASCRDKKALQ
jgi:hypothetical protein